MTNPETIAQRLDRHHANGVITRLEREAIWLHEIKKLTYRQIAAGLHLSVSTVWDRARRGEHKMHAADRKLHEFNTQQRTCGIDATLRIS